jgi:hypothetical protein
MLKFNKGGGYMKEGDKPFNDVVDHFNKIKGNASEVIKTDLIKLPRPIRYDCLLLYCFFVNANFKYF